MIVAIDTTTSPAGEIAPATLGLIDALARPGSPAGRLVLVGREEHRRSLVGATFGTATVLSIDPPEPGRRQVTEYRRRKLAMLADHGASLMHVAGGPLDALAVEQPVVLSVDGLTHRTSPGQLGAAERWHRRTWWAASAFRADAIVVPDLATADTLQAELGVHPAKLFVASADRPLAAVVAAYAAAARAHPTRKAA